jgi:hypothetical protein
VLLTEEMDRFHETDWCHLILTTSAKLHKSGIQEALLTCP